MPSHSPFFRKHERLPGVPIITFAQPTRTVSPIVGVTIASTIVHVTMDTTNRTGKRNVFQIPHRARMTLFVRQILIVYHNERAMIRLMIVFAIMDSSNRRWAKLSVFPSLRLRSRRQ